MVNGGRGRGGHIFRARKWRGLGSAEVFAAREKPRGGQAMVGRSPVMMHGLAKVGGIFPLDDWLRTPNTR